MDHVVSQCKSLIVKVQAVPDISAKYSCRLGMCSGYEAVAVVAFSCLSILGICKPINPGRS